MKSFFLHFDIGLKAARKLKYFLAEYRGKNQTCSSHIITQDLLVKIALCTNITLEIEKLELTGAPVSSLAVAQPSNKSLNAVKEISETGVTEDAKGLAGWDHRPTTTEVRVSLLKKVKKPPWKSFSRAGSY